MRLVVIEADRVGVENVFDEVGVAVSIPSPTLQPPGRVAQGVGAERHVEQWLVGGEQFMQERSGRCQCGSGGDPMMLGEIVDDLTHVPVHDFDERISG